MKIVICGSMKFAKQIYDVADQLRKLEHTALLPEFVIEFINGKLGWELGTLSGSEGADKKKKYDLIKVHFQKIKYSDAVLILNYTKNGIENYIGGNTFLEMGFAHILNKPIYLMNSLPKKSSYLEEMLVMKPIVIEGDLAKIK